MIESRAVETNNNANIFEVNEYNKTNLKTKDADKFLCYFIMQNVEKHQMWNIRFDNVVFARKIIILSRNRFPKTQTKMWRHVDIW
jgi:hypothetical protein